MKITSNLSPSHIEKNKSFIENHDILVVDANVNQETLEFIASNLHIPLFCDATSDKKCLRIINILNNIKTVKMNYKEACILSGLEVQETPDIDILKSALQKMPIKSCYVTLGEHGSFYLSKTNYYHQKLNKIIPAKNVLGAGDVYCAEIIKGILNNSPVKSILEASTNAAESHLAKNNTNGVMQ
jgi:pseudouridine kinase